MSDQEWNRICSRAAWTHSIAFCAILFPPFFIAIEAPEFAARVDAWLAALPDIVEVTVYLVWFACLIGCFFPPRRIFGRGFWALGAVGLFALAYWAAATDKISDTVNAVSVVWVLLFALCVAGIIFDGPKSWERRYRTGGGEVDRKD